MRPSPYSQTLPDPADPAAGTTLVSEWHVGTPSRQQAAAEALLGEWAGLSEKFKPTAFVQLSTFASADGEVLLSYAQWASDEAHSAFAREHRGDMVNRIDQAVPGITRPGLARCRVHSAALTGPRAGGAPGADSGDGGATDSGVTVLRVAAESPDAAKSWATAASAASKEQARAQGPARHPAYDPARHPAPVSGSAGQRGQSPYAAHTLLSRDGAHALLYAQWAAPLDGVPRDAWPHLPEVPGTRAASFRRYRLFGTVLGPGGPGGGGRQR